MKQLNYDIGRRIALLRERDHMTQEQLSEILRKKMVKIVGVYDKGFKKLFIENK